MKPADEERLAGLPVRQIPQDLLAEYNNGARTEKTPVEEVKHFLPRYFELISQFQFPTHSAELSLSRLSPFDESEWTTEELELLQQFSNEYFRHCLSIYPLPDERIDTILIMFWTPAINMNRLLAIWGNEMSKESVLHFRDLYFRGFDQYHRAKLSNAFGETDLGTILKTWLDSGKVRQNFAEAIERLIIEKNDIEEEDINELNLLYEMIRVRKDA